MSDVKIGTLSKLLHKYMKRQKPFFIHGAPGIGKSDSVRAAAKQLAEEKGLEYHEGKLDEKKFCLVDVRVSQLDPSDLRGIPFPEGANTKWLIPSWLPTSGEGVIFFDELNLAPPSIQASCYQLILDRRLGDYVLPTGWTILAAGNRAIDKANVFPMAAPLKNRFSHATLLVPSQEEWCDWALDNGIKPDIVAFLQFKPSMLFKFDANSKDDAFPTPRTWALASYMTEECENVEEESLIVSTCVGEGVSHEYQGFINLKRKVKIDELLKNPKKIKDLNTVGLKYSAISGLAEKYRGENKPDPRKKMLEKILAVVDHMEPEFGMFCLRLVKGMAPSETVFQNDLMGAKMWEKLYKQYNKFVFK
jgi:hypothetical protein